MFNIFFLISHINFTKFKKIIYHCIIKSRMFFFFKVRWLGLTSSKKKRPWLFSFQNMQFFKVHCNRRKLYTHRGWRLLNIFLFYKKNPKSNRSHKVNHLRNLFHSFFGGWCNKNLSNIKFDNNKYKKNYYVITYF